MNLNNTPQLSIITINRNDAQGLEKTLESIWKKQSFKDFEHIIIDGASTDNSINIIKKYASHLSYWVSEPDKGIYNAMNKGIIKAKGNYLLFLNAKVSIFEDRCLYHYIVRSTSASREKLNEYRIFDPIRVKKIILTLAKE